MSVPTPLPRPARPPISEEQRAEVLRRVNRGSVSLLGLLWDSARSFAIAIVLFLVVRAFFVEAFKIPSGSMERTLLVGDFLLVNKLVYGAEVPLTGTKLPPLRRPERGDVIVFQWPSDVTKNFVKRIVGMPGDTLEMRHGILFLNGVPQSERYATRTAPGEDAPADGQFGWQRDHLVRTAEARIGYHPSRNTWGPLVVPPRHYFVLGDNRDNSLDSRYWGFVPDSLVRGQPMFVYYSYAPDTAQSFAWLTNIRWSRLGERID